MPYFSSDNIVVGQINIKATLKSGLEGKDRNTGRNNY